MNDPSEAASAPETRPPAIGKVVLVATPIGNLADITLRALEALRTADVIACEDTRHSRRLLDRHGIERPMISFHEHNEAARTAEIIQRVARGQTVAVVSDAGMPGICDPGLRLVHACRREGLACEALPGACAVPLALAVSGLPAGEFYFGGFLPVKKGARERVLREALERETATSVFYESPHRLDGTLDLLAALEPGRLACVARELTKIHETCQRASAAELAAWFHAHPPRGEIVLLVAPRLLPKFMHDAPAATAGV
jgi:16S rRNA (cytidine1402-2'-O)-methyltransferase